MAKGSRGGKRGAVGGAGGAAGVAQNDDAIQQVQNVAPTMSTGYNDFLTMTDDDKADVISSLVGQQVPAHLSDSSFQRFTYNLGLNDKPQLVDDATLDKMSGKQIFRTVDSVYDRKNDISYTADQICKQIQGGRVTRTSDNGRSVYGRGIYFADSRSGSVAYGSFRGDIKKTAMVRAKLNSNANIIDYGRASSGARAEMRSGSKLGKALQKCDNASAVSIYAMSKGYNVISSGHGYFNVLNRQAMTMSKTISAK